MSVSRSPVIMILLAIQGAGSTSENVPTTQALREGMLRLIVAASIAAKSPLLSVRRPKQASSHEKTRKKAY